MTVAARFEGTDPVARYWLANCTGFAVEGAERGVVEELLRDADPHVTTRLVVRTRGGRRTIVPAASIATVVPAERVLVVEREPRQPREWPRVRAAGVMAASASGTGARAVGATLAAAGPPARSAAVTGARAVGAALVAAEPPARRAALAFGRSLAELAVPAAGTVLCSLAALASEARATAAMIVRSARKRRWTIVRSWR
jgi:hypothetical protein